MPMSDQPINPLCLKLGLLLLAVCYALPVHALSTDVEQPVSLEADSVVFNKQAGTAVYSGNVEIKQGTLFIRASQININAPGNEIQSIIATGSPVNFRQSMDNGKQAVGSAKSMQYFVIQKRLILDGNASLTQDKDAFTSNHIEYSTATGELKAGGQKTAEGQTPGRVKAIFYPTNKAK